MSWLQTGEESEKLAEQEKAAQEKRREEMGKAFRFYLKEKGNEADLIFCDGDLGPKGYLIPPRAYEHGYVWLNNERHDIICPHLTRPAAGDKCPLCEGRDRASLVSYFTVIDCRPYTTKNNVVIPYDRKLFVAKPQTFEILNKMAAKLGGLRGAKFNVSRTGDKSPAVGDTWIPTGKLTPDEMKKFTKTFEGFENNKKVTKTINCWEPLNYETELAMYTGDQLRKMGFGMPSTAPNMPHMPNAGEVKTGSPMVASPGETQTQVPEQSGDQYDYSKHL